MKKLLLLISIPLCTFASDLTLEKETLHQIGLKIWQNECRGTLDGLISWNQNEEFPSLGIGHFIWYPIGEKKNFEETFPDFIQFLKSHEIELPTWVAKSKGCPWKTRETFLKDRRSKKIRELRDLLSKTLDLQFLFLIERFKKAEELLSPNLSAKEKKHLEMLKKSPQGIYALVDYVNFKGTGLSEKERYRNKGWGLLQVLQQIPASVESDDIMRSFINSGKRVLAKRVRNSPKSRNEERWLKGWYKRLETYQNTKS